MFYIDDTYESDIRFDPAKFMGYSNDCYDILTSYFVHSLKDVEPSGMKLISKEEGRPDLLSFNLYTNTQFWWILLLVNIKTKYTDIQMGDQMSYYSLSDLESIYFRLKSLDSASKRDDIGGVPDVLSLEVTPGNNNGGGNWTSGDIVPNETPSGIIDGINKLFSLQYTPSANTLMLFINGIGPLQSGGKDYTLTNKVIEFTDLAVPRTGDAVLAYYFTLDKV